VLATRPDDRRALAALRRLAARSGNRDTWARSSYALAVACRDTDASLALLRDALLVFEHSGPAHNARYAVVILREIVTRDPRAPERRRLLQRLRESGDKRTLLAVLSAQLTALAESSPQH